jgi:signal transduction histidine kinase
LTSRDGSSVDRPPSEASRAALAHRRLLGLADRLAVLDGRLRVESPPDGGTLIAADIPLPD